MSIHDTVHKNYAELLLDDQLSLQINDPELLRILTDFTDEEVVPYGNLSSKTRMMIILASLIAMQTLDEYEVMLNRALNADLTPIEVKEIVYQCVPYVGIAKVYDFLHATNEILQDKGVELPLPGQATTTPDTRYIKGLEVQKQIFGSAIDQMYAQSPKNQLHIQEYLSANCFGDYYTRKGLDIKTRELLTFSIILSLGGCEPQLKGHIQGNINVGNDKETLLSAVTQLLPYIGYPRTLNAIRCLNEVIPEATE